MVNYLSDSIGSYVPFMLKLKVQPLLPSQVFKPYRPMLGIMSRPYTVQPRLCRISGLELTL
jgi:hypothetical protein